MKILTARPHRLLAACVDRLGEATARGEGCMFLVPSQYTLQAELEIMERLHVSGSFLIDVLSPKRLQSRVFELAGMPKQTLFDERGKCMVLSSIIEAQKDELSVYRGAAQNGSSGFTARMSSMIASLKRSGLSAADVVRSTESMDTESPARPSSAILRGSTRPTSSGWRANWPTRRIYRGRCARGSRPPACSRGRMCSYTVLT